MAGNRAGARRRFPWTEAGKQQESGGPAMILTAVKVAPSISAVRNASRASRELAAKNVIVSDVCRSVRIESAAWMVVRFAGVPRSEDAIGECVRPLPTARRPALPSACAAGRKLRPGFFIPGRAMRAQRFRQPVQVRGWPEPSIGIPWGE